MGNDDLVLEYFKVRDFIYFWGIILEYNYYDYGRWVDKVIKGKGFYYLYIGGEVVRMDVGSESEERSWRL